MAWYEHLKDQLVLRNKREVLPFQSLINSYSEAVHREEALLDEIDSAKDSQQRQDQLVKSLQEQITAIKNSPSLGASGGADVSKKYNELFAKYEALKEEQTQLYRTQNQNVQKLLDLSEQVKSGESAKDSLEVAFQAAVEEHQQLRQVIGEMEATLDEKDLGLRVMQDELTALQLELLKTDEKIEKLEGENKELVGRWIQKVSETADILNDQLTVPRSKSQCMPQSISQSPRQCPSTMVNSFAVEGKKELINSLVLAQTQNTLAICTTYSSIGLHSLPDGTKEGYLWGGPKTGISNGAFNKTGDLFAGTTISGSAGSSSIYVWHVPTEKIRAQLDGHDGMVTGAAFLQGDDTKLATVGQDRTVRIWDLPRGFCLRTFEIPAEGTSIVAFKSFLASGHRDGSVGFWDERVPTTLGITSLHPKAITNLSLDTTSSQDTLITASLDHSPKIMDCASRRTLQSFSHQNFRVGPYGTLPAGSPDGKYVAAGSANGDLFVWGRSWGAEVEAVLEGHKASVVAAVWTKDTDGQSMIASADRNGTVMIWK